jgi:DNA-binding NtrC family response regulator
MGEDIIIIATHLLKIFNIEFKKTVNGFSDNAKQAMLNYSWPGNVRELSNCLERAMIFIEKDRIDARDLTFFQAPAPQTAPAYQDWTVPSNGIVLEEVERQLIISALELARNNKSKAARLLGLTRDTLRYRLEKHQLE